MKGICISLDVSKGSSYYQGFKAINEPISKAKKINHDKEGFEELLKFCKNQNDSTIIFESTGIYHKTLQVFLNTNNMKYIIISPLLSAKVRKSDIRSTKTDKKDCSSIAKVFYLKELRYHNENDSLFEELREKSRHYTFLMDEMKRWKVEFRRLLDIVYPNFDTIYNQLYSEIIMNVLKEYSHPNELKKRRLDTITKFIETKTPHQKQYAQRQAKILKDYADSCVSGCDSNSTIVIHFKEVLFNLSAQLDYLETYLEGIIEIAKKVEYFNCVKSIPGLADNLSSRIMAELGDINRFDNANQVIAYAGLDPSVYQSGQLTGEHLRITKKGNSNLRTLLYLAVTIMIRTRRNTTITLFYNKKKQQGMNSKAAIVACMNKTLRIIYSLCKTKSTFQ